MIWKVPQNTIAQWGDSLSDLKLGESYSVLIWNVYKGQKGLRFAEDLKRLSGDKSFLLLQETMLAAQNPLPWKKDLGDMCWSVAQSFEFKMNDSSTGVAIGSRTKPLSLDFIRPETRELFWLTPKISLFAEYDFQGVRTLFVSCHVLNFVTTAAFIHSLEEIAERVSRFEGPVVLAGDFNTWNLKRFLAMKAVFRSLKLEHVEMEQDTRFLKLDHLFVRGFDVEYSCILHAVETSDHFPLEARLRLEK